MPNPDDLPSSASTSPERQHAHRDGDSDPEEADIEEHLGPHGFVYRQTRSEGHGDNHLHWHQHQADPSHEHHHHHHHHNRQNPPIDPVLQRFADMLQGFGQPGRQMNLGGNRHATVQRTTFTSRTMGGGTTSVTIFSGPPTHPGRGPQDDPFQE